MEPSSKAGEIYFCYPFLSFPPNQFSAAQGLHAVLQLMYLYCRNNPLSGLMISQDPTLLPFLAFHVSLFTVSSMWLILVRYYGGKSSG